MSGTEADGGGAIGVLAATRSNLLHGDVQRCVGRRKDAVTAPQRIQGVSVRYRSEEESSR